MKNNLKPCLEQWRKEAAQQNKASHVLLTDEQAHQIEDAFASIRVLPDEFFGGHIGEWWQKCRESLATIRAARAQADHSGEANKMVQEPVAILESSKANFERQFGKQIFADWIYDDLTYLFESAAPARTKDLTDAVNRLKRIAMIAHYGGLANMTKDDALTAIRKITIPYFDRDASDEEARVVITEDREKNK